MNKLDVLLVYPQLGSFDSLIRDIPLSLIYAATDSVKHNLNVRIIDLRLKPDNWEKQVDSHLRSGCSLVGLSVMTGNPITNSLRISKYIKEKYGTPIVWGGPHPTVLPEQTLENEYIDYVVRDWGSKALFQLIQHIRGESNNIKTILGIGYKENGRIALNPPQCSFEMLDYKDLPYHLIDIKGDNYSRLSNRQVVFPIFTSIGCPYKCTFCMSPTVNKKIKGKKWVAYSIDYVLGHVGYLLGKYDFQRLQIYDDDSFVDLDRMYDLLYEYVRRGFHKKHKLDFRGVRINELDRMDDDYLKLMVKANVELLITGVESGSGRILKEMNKGITVEQIIRVNQKLAKYPSLKPHYNFFCGIPGETMEDLIQTKGLLLRLVKDHPTCYLGVGADWKPLPGSVMTVRAVHNYGLKLPGSLNEWASIDSCDAKKIIHPWYTKEIDNMIKLLQMTGMLLDKKIEDLRGDMGFMLGYTLYFLSILYRPILLYRIKHNNSSFLIEYGIRNYFMRNLGKLISKLKRYNIF